MITENLTRIRGRIEEAALRAGRKPQDVTLVCVTKTATAEKIREVVASGIADIGENRVQDALSKYNKLGDLAKSVRWHMVGHLQTNKVKAALEIFDVIHSLDSMKLAEEIDRRAEPLDRRIDCFIEVNTSGEDSKYGIRPEDAQSFLREAAAFPNIHIIGLMTIAPFLEDAQLCRAYFVKLRRLKEELNGLNMPDTGIKELSMGMSQDFEVATEEGATFLRVGTAIFGV
ncbi:MAG: YggS family pyridoxal phosphate-dependent enzyme [Candidatus Omnitrophota bacterium]